MGREGRTSSIVEMCVHMDCSGCERKIRKALLKLEGVHEVDIDMGKQKVTVTGWVDQKRALKAVRKTGRRAVLWPYLMNAEATTAYNQEYYHRYHPALASVSASTSMDHTGLDPYNYRKHGYDDSSAYEYHQKSAYNQIVDERVTMMFNDENPNACSIM